MREAVAIELLDTQNWIHVTGADREPLLDPIAKRCTLWGSELVDVGRVFGLGLSHRAAIGHIQRKDKVVERLPDDVELNIYAGELDSWECDAIQAVVEGGCLTFRVSGTTGKGEPWTGEYTYCGKFAVHWA